MKCGITPENITDLKDNEVFVFGSNLAGHHGAGAARTALQWGAAMGIGVGLSGQTYALPTKDGQIMTMPIHEIKPYVDDLYFFAAHNPNKTFLVTKVGCGLAGYSENDIAPLFSGFTSLENCTLPQEFIDIINGEV